MKLIFGLLLCSVAGAEMHSICVSDRVGLNRPARVAFETELRDLLAESGTDIRLNVCEGPTITLHVKMYPPERYSRALGLAYRSGNRVLPELRVYTEPVLKILGNQRTSVLLGRALARVAAHEIGHYTRQQTHHDCQGLMRDSFTALNLAARDY